MNNTFSCVVDICPSNETSAISCTHCRKHYYPMPQHCRQQGSAKCGGERVTYLQDWCQSLIPRLCSDSSAASSEVLTSITRSRFAMPWQLFAFGMCTSLTSSLAFNLLSLTALLCCRNVATSTSGGHIRWRARLALAAPIPGPHHLQTRGTLNCLGSNSLFFL